MLACSASAAAAVSRPELRSAVSAWDTRCTVYAAARMPDVASCDHRNDSAGDDERTNGRHKTRLLGVPHTFGHRTQQSINKISPQAVHT